MNISIIGTGNTASVLGRKLKEAGHRILEVCGRDPEAAGHLASRLDSRAVNDPRDFSNKADIYIIAVSDQAIRSVADGLKLPGKIIVHTAASVSKEALNAVSENYGVFYPLQTLKSNSSHVPEIPVVIDASNAASMQKLQQLAHTITTEVIIADDDQRARIHLAAVVCNNFVNHLFTLTEDYCNKEEIDFKLFLPLIHETVARMLVMPAAQAQTGPAIRNDHNTIKKHLEMLKPYPALQKIYSLFTESIQSGAITSTD